MIETMFGRRLIVPALAAMLLGAAFVAAPPATAQSARQQAPTEHPAQKLVSVDFAGGTTAQYYDALQKALGQNVVVIMPGAEAVTMPPVKLTNVPFGEAVRVAKYVQSEHRIVVESEGQTWIVVPVQVRSIIAPPSGPQTRTWSVAEYVTDAMPAEALLSAVQAGLDLQGAHATLKYHDQTKVLFAQGTTEELKLAHETLDAVNTSARAGGVTLGNSNIYKELGELSRRISALETAQASTAR